MGGACLQRDEWEIGDMSGMLEADWSLATNDLPFNKKSFRYLRNRIIIYKFIHKYLGSIN